MGRPEHTSPPQEFYGPVEAAKYTASSRIISIQNEMAYRALELLAIPDGNSAYILDIGCGSGLSGEVLTEEGHEWVGLDIAESMLKVAKEREVDGDLFLQDIGQGLGFRAGVFDGCISISVIQWLCNADDSSHVPRKRLMNFFNSLYTCMARGARCVFQFYPENNHQMEMIVGSSMKAGFSGGLVVDYPNSTRAKKYFLCLFAGASTASALPKGLETTQEEHAGVVYNKERIKVGRKASKKKVIDKDWVLRKKELNRVRGKVTPLDSKFTARKRRTKF